MADFTLKYARPDGTYVADVVMGDRVWPYHVIPEEEQMWALAQKWLEENPGYEFPPEPPPEPSPTFIDSTKLSPHQAHARLTAAEKLEPFYEWLEAQPLVKRKEFEYAEVHIRGNSVLDTGLKALGMNDQELDFFWGIGA